MSIEKMWKELQSNDADLTEMLQNTNLIGASSIHPLKKLKQKIGLSIVLTMVILLLYLIAFFLFDLWTFRLALALVVVVNLWITISSWRLYQSIDVTISPYVPLKKLLQTTLDNFNQWRHLQQKLSLFVFPIATVGGFTLGLVIGSGKSLETVILNPIAIIALAISLIAFSISGLWLTKKIYTVAYGKHLKSLEENLQQLMEQ